MSFKSERSQRVRNIVNTQGRTKNTLNFGQHEIPVSVVVTDVSTASAAVILREYPSGWPIYMSGSFGYVIGGWLFKPGSHDSISISIRAKQKAKQRNQVKPAT